MAMNVLGIAGSPEIGGNTEILLDKTLEGCKSIENVETEKIVVCKLNIGPCSSCRSCASTGECKANDDMDYVASRLIWADRIIVASPVYFMGVTAQLKCLIDRCQLFWCRKYLLNKPISGSQKGVGRKGMIISTGGNKVFNIFESVRKTIRSFFVTIDVECDDEDSILIKGMEEKKAVLDYPNHLEAAYNLGRKLVSKN